jgi:hypothetical protein
MSETTNFPQSDDPLKADVQKALLAAFGDDAMDWLDEDEELELQTNSQPIADASDENAPAAEANLNDLLEEISSAIEGSPVAENGLAPLGELDDEEDVVVDLGPRMSFSKSANNSTECRSTEFWKLIAVEKSPRCQELQSGYEASRTFEVKSFPLPTSGN